MRVVVDAVVLDAATAIVDGVFVGAARAGPRMVGGPLGVGRSVKKVNDMATNEWKIEDRSTALQRSSEIRDEGNARLEIRDQRFEYVYDVQYGTDCTSKECETNISSGGPLPFQRV